MKKLERLMRDMINEENNLVDEQYKVKYLDEDNGSVTVKIKYSTEDEDGFLFSQIKIYAFINDKINKLLNK